MNLRQKRLANELQKIAADTVLQFEQNHVHEYGIISITGVEIDRDYEYVDISIASQFHNDRLASFLAPSADMIKRTIAKELSLRKIPILRFRLGKKSDKVSDILSLIDSLDSQYGLSLHKNP